MPIDFRQPLSHTAVRQNLRWWLVVLTALVILAGCKRKKPATSLQPAVVIGDSMAPHFLGKHQLVECGCGSVFACGISDLDCICPKCGTANDAAKATRVSPEQVKIDSTKEPKRWDVVAFKRSDGTAAIKRVVGMQGEELSFINGNVFVRTESNAQWIRLVKNISQQQNMAIVVNDSRYISSKPMGWQPVGSSKWIFKDQEQLGFAVWKAAKDSNGNRYDWIEFVPGRSYAHKPSTDSAPVEDNYGFNQSLKRDLHAMDELLTEFRFKTLDGRIQIRISFQGNDYRIFLNYQTKKFELKSNQATEFESRGDFVVGERDALQRLLVSTIDGNLVVMLNDRKMVEQPMPMKNEGSPNLVSTRPIGFGISAGQLEMQSITVSRDLYYYRLAGGGRLVADEGYLVLGDNVPVSRDSRHWSEPQVPRSKIIGVVEKK